jgi:phosphatidylserine/phosphatidylglycerophosphate/cardiolipin synthase-like enzyme
VTGLSGVSLPQLEHLLRLVEVGQLASLSRTAMLAHGLGAIWDEVAWLAPLDAPALEAVLRVAITERITRPVPRIELVWTGPEARVSAARDTAVVVRELFAKARRSVIVGGYAFTSGADILAPLHTAMRDRGVDAALFLHVDDALGVAAEDAARAGIERFLQLNWPFGDPIPRLYYDPRTVAPGSSINLHAKCVVVDERWALVGSANFTHSAHHRNIETSALIEDPGFATALAAQWRGLVQSALVKAF